MYLSVIDPLSITPPNKIGAVAQERTIPKRTSRVTIWLTLWLKINGFEQYLTKISF